MRWKIFAIYRQCYVWCWRVCRCCYLPCTSVLFYTLSYSIYDERCNLAIIRVGGRFEWTLFQWDHKILFYEMYLMPFNCQTFRYHWIKWACDSKATQFWLLKFIDTRNHTWNCYALQCHKYSLFTCVFSVLLFVHAFQLDLCHTSSLNAISTNGTIKINSDLEELIGFTVVCH